MDDTRRLPIAARLLIGLMAVAGGLSVIARSPDVLSWRTADLATCLALIAGITLTELYRIPLRHRTQTLNFSVTEALWAGALVLARPSVLTLAVAAGVCLSQVIRRQPGYKLAFNIGQFTVSLTVAQVVYGVLNPQGVFTSRAWIAAGLAMATYAIFNASLVAMVIAFVERQPFLAVFLPPVKVNALHFAANTAIGLEGALVWAASPAALSILLIPLILAHITYRTLVRALRAGERERELIIEHASDGILLIDADGRVLSWNPAMERITGFSEEEAVERGWSQLLGLSEAAAHGSGGSMNGHEPIAAASGFGSAPTVSARAPKTGLLGSLVAKDGSPAWIQYSCNPVMSGDGKVDVTVVVVHDVTAQRQTEQLKSDFVATISHELRTPLTPLKGFLFTLLKGTVEDTLEARREYYQIMLKQTNRLESLITELLEASRVESDTPLVHNQIVEVTRPIQELVRGYAEEQPDRIILFEEQERPILAIADASVLDLVLSNLVSNALKYSERDTPVTVSVGVRDGHALVSVRDHGVGIPLSEQQRIFDRFYQVESAHLRTNGGVGLGLYIAKRLVEAMAGRLWVESQAGLGSTFSFELPLAVTQERALSLVSAAAS